MNCLHIFVVFIVTFTLSSSLSINGKDERLQNLNSAFESIIKSLATTEHEVVRVVNFNVDQEFIYEVIFKNLKNSAVQFVIDAVDDLKSYAISKTSILMINSMRDLSRVKLDQNNRLLAPQSPRHFYVLCSKFEISFLTELANRDIESRRSRQNNTNFDCKEMSDILQFYYFFVEEVDFIKLVTFVWYTSEKCSEPQLTEVNKFERKTLKWNHSKFSIKKFEDFKGCQVNIGNTNDISIFQQTEKDGSVGLAGFNYEIVKDLSKPLNFKLFVYTHRYGHKKNLSVDHYVSIQCIKMDMRIVFLSTRPYIYSKIYVAVPPGEIYGPYEKLILPYDETVWILIASTFLVAFSIVFIVCLMKKQIGEIVFGRKISTPALNIVMIFCGIPQHLIPSRFFARYIAMMFILYSLIIRTAWQGKMFEFLQKEMRKPQLKTMREIVKKGYTVYLDYDNFDYLAQAEVLAGAKVLGYLPGHDYFNKHIFNSSFEGALTLDSLFLANKVNETKGKFLQRLLEEPFDTDICGMFFERYHKFFNVFDRKIDQLFEAGLTDHYIDINKDLMNLKRYAHLYPDGPQVLTVHHLEPGLIIWLVTVSFAGIVFVFECLIGSLKFVKESFLLKILMKAFIDTQLYA